MSRPSTALPLASLAAALKNKVPPTSRERVPPGLRKTPDTPPLPELLLLLPRQPVRARTKVMANASKKPEPQRCMNPLVRFQSFKISRTGPALNARRRLETLKLWTLAFNVVARKTVSVEGKVQGFKVVKPQVSKFQGFRVSKTEAGD